VLKHVFYGLDALPFIQSTLNALKSQITSLHHIQMVNDLVVLTCASVLRHFWLTGMECSH